MSLQVFKKSSPLTPLLVKVIQARIKEKKEIISSLIKKNQKIIDIGAGNCLLAEALLKEGYKVKAIDIRDDSLSSVIKPELYDGKTIPSKNKEFDVSLLITVLHHIAQPEKVLKEAGRVSRKILIIEEVYTNYLNRQLTFTIDSLFNLEFFNHPHSNKTDQQWKETFSKLGFKLEKASYHRSLGVLQRAIYYLTT